jgi:hypothetical protein
MRKKRDEERRTRKRERRERARANRDLTVTSSVIRDN